MVSTHLSGLEAGQGLGGEGLDIAQIVAMNRRQIEHRQQHIQAGQQNRGGVRPGTLGLTAAQANEQLLQRNGLGVGVVLSFPHHHACHRHHQQTASDGHAD